MEARVTFPPFSTASAHNWFAPQTFNTGSISFGSFANGIIFPNNGNSYFNYYSEGVFTPSITGLTVVPGTGGVSYSGVYERIGSLVKWQVLIAVTGTCTTQSAGGLGTVISNLPYNTYNTDVCNAIDGYGQNGGIGLVSGMSAYLPAWGALNRNITISGQFYI